MANSLEKTMKGVNELKQEVSSWEHRLETLKSDIEGLKRAKEAIEKEITEKRSLFNQDVERRTVEIRRGETDLHEREAKLKEDREEVARAMVAFQSEKAAVENAKRAAEASKANYETATENVGRFILLVKREAEKL